MLDQIRHGLRQLAEWLGEIADAGAPAPNRDPIPVPVRDRRPRR